VNFHAIACWNFPIPFAKSAGTIGSLGNPSSLVGFALTFNARIPSGKCQNKEYKAVRWLDRSGTA
jgi:hypothetical protein